MPVITRAATKALKRDQVAPLFAALEPAAPEPAAPELAAPEPQVSVQDSHRLKGPLEKWAGIRRRNPEMSRKFGEPFYMQMHDHYKTKQIRSLCKCGEAVAVVGSNWKKHLVKCVAAQAKT